MILIITVNYNNASVTNEMLDNVEMLNINKDIKVVVVDNNSSDKEELKRNDFTEILYLNNNIGYFPALNKGLLSVDVNEYDYIIICNNDLIFENSFFKRLKEKKYIEKVYSISPRILDMDNKDQNPVWETGPSKFKMFFYDLYYKNYYFGQVLYKLWQFIKPKNLEMTLSSKPIFQGYGAIYILTKTFFYKNKLLDSPSFLMEEEAFLGYQVSYSGGVQYFDTDLVVHHKEHSSCKKIPSKTIYHYSKESFKISRGITFKTKLITPEMLEEKYEYK